MQGGSSTCRVGLADEGGDLREGLRDRVDADAVTRVQLTELVDALAPHARILVLEADFKDCRKDLAEGVDRADCLENAADTLSNDLLAIADLQDAESDS